LAQVTTIDLFDMFESLTRTTFEPHQNTTFRLELEGADPLDLELVEVTDKTPERFPGEQFSTIFRGPSEVYLPQSIYPLEHPQMGRLNLFLVPVDHKKDGYYYEAFFNIPDPDDA
jgi:hypothetical protein